MKSLIICIRYWITACVYCGRLESWIFCACLFPFSCAFALASWQENGALLHALLNKNIQGTKSNLQADRSIPLNRNVGFDSACFMGIRGTLETFEKLHAAS